MPKAKVTLWHRRRARSPCSNRGIIFLEGEGQRGEARDDQGRCTTSVVVPRQGERRVHRADVLAVAFDWNGPPGALGKLTLCIRSVALRNVMQVVRVLVVACIVDLTRQKDNMKVSQNKQRGSRPE
jgi:hypothetical protein